MRYETINVQPGNAATKLVSRGEIATLVNSDPVNGVILGDTNNVQIGDQYSTPFSAGQTAVFGTETWAIANPGTVVTIFKYPGVQFLGGISPQSPSAVPPNVVAASIGSGNTVNLIGGTGGFPNPLGLPIQLINANINSGVVAAVSPSASFLVEDTLVDNMANEYLSCEIGMAQGNGGQAFNSAQMNFNNAQVLAGHRLTLVNGGTGGVTGVLRRCSATVSFYLVNV